MEDELFMDGGFLADKKVDAKLQRRRWHTVLPCNNLAPNAQGARPNGSNGSASQKVEQGRILTPRPSIMSQ